MDKICFNNPKRLITFGCSFTEYCWPTWANILAEDFKIPFYNYARRGASNLHIFNMLMQADHYLRFDKDDVIIVCWTNVFRNDIHKNGKWITNGCVYNHRLEDISDPFGFSVRDLAAIKGSYEFLKSKNLNFHFLKMIDFDYASQDMLDKKYNLKELKNIYADYLDKIHDSFYQVLWNNDLDNKNKSIAKIHKRFTDNHPTILEHFQYLQTVVDHKWKSSTVDIVHEKNNLMIDIIRTEIEVVKDTYQIDFSKYPNLQLGKSLPINFV